MNKKQRIAVVGAGHLGRYHARLLAEMADVELVAVADPIAPAREALATECRTQAVADYRELLDNVDGAVIATPTRLHHQVSINFLRHGISLLVEKPLTADLKEAEELVEAAAKTGATLQVGHIERFNPAFVAVQPIMRRVRYIDAVRASGYTGRSTDIGVVHDLLIHDIDLVLSLVQAPLVHVSAVGVALLGKFEDAVQARLEFVDGAVANLSASRVSYHGAPKRQMQIWSDEGFAAIDFGTRTTQIVRPCDAVRQHTYDYNSLDAAEKAAFHGKLFTEILPLETLEVEARNALADELRDFLDALHGRSTPRVTGAAGRDALAVAEAILQSARDHAWPDVAKDVSAAPSIIRPPHWQHLPLPQREAG